MARSPSLARLAALLAKELLKDTFWKTTSAAPSATESAKVTEGVYKVGDDIYKVVRAVHGSENLYAKVLTDQGDGTWKFEITRGMIIFNELKATDKLSLEDAKAFGQLYGVCCCCGAYPDGRGQHRGRHRPDMQREGVRRWRR